MALARANKARTAIKNKANSECFRRQGHHAGATVHDGIALGLAWPDRVPDAAPSYDWSVPRTWSFEPLDDAAFPAVALARRCGKAGGTAPAVFNAANEVCVDAFCDGALGFLGIVDTVDAVVNEHLASGHVPDADLTVAAVLAADAWARRRAAEVIA